MGKFFMPWRLCLQNFRKWTVNPRLYVLACLLFIDLYYTSQGLIGFCQYADTTVTPYLLPMLMESDRDFLFLGLVLLFCDAPFLDEEQPYILLRSGKKRWMAGQVLYLAVGALAYFVFIQLLYLVFLVGYLGFDMEWGNVLVTVANGQSPPEYGLAFPPNLIDSYDPLNGLILCTGICVLLGLMLGLLMFALNVRFNRAIGALAASAVVLLSNVDFGNPNQSIYFRPVAWADAGNLDFKGVSAMPSAVYVLGVLAVLIVLLTLLCYLFIRKKNIEVMPQI